MAKGLFLIAVFFGMFVNAQEFNCLVQINADQVTQNNQTIFKTLERSLTEFINNTKWTELEYRTEERINCSFFITVKNNSSDRFESTIQVVASRPVFGSDFSTTLFNYNDKEFNFNYLEYQPLNYNPSSYDSNLVSVITYYLYTILGIDSDSFAPNGGTKYFKIAKSIVDNALGSGEAGWRNQKTSLDRFRLNDDILSGTFEGFRKAMYHYHRIALDTMNEDAKKGKQEVIKALGFIQEMNKARANSYLNRVFFDAKSDEIAKILTGGPTLPIAETVEQLRRMAPTYSQSWNTIKF